MGSLVKPSSLLRSNMAVTAFLITLCLFAASSAEPEAEATAAADPGYFHHGYHGYHHLATMVIMVMAIIMEREQLNQDIISMATIMDITIHIAMDTMDITMERGLQSPDTMDIFTTAMDITDTIIMGIMDTTMDTMDTTMDEPKGLSEE